MKDKHMRYGCVALKKIEGFPRSRSSFSLRFPWPISPALTKLHGLMAEITDALTRQIAHLARLELSEAEVQTFTPQLGEVLQYVNLLQSVDVVGVQPLTYPFEVPTPLRPDVWVPPALDDSGKPRVLQCGPDVVQDGYKVPP